MVPTRHTTLEVLVSDGTWSHSRTSHSRASLATNNITEPAETAHHRHGDGEIWGLRAEESAGRRAALTTALRRAGTCTCCATPGALHTTHGGVITRNDGTVAYSPVWNWTTREIWGHITRRRLPRNPVYAKLAQLGAPEQAQRVAHLVDAGELHRGRLVWLKRGWPDLYEIVVDVLPGWRNTPETQRSFDEPCPSSSHTSTQFVEQPPEFFIRGSWHIIAQVGVIVHCLDQLFGEARRDLPMLRDALLV